MEVISNVNAQRSAVRSIAWLGLGGDRLYFHELPFACFPPDHAITLVLNAAMMKDVYLVTIDNLKLKDRAVEIVEGRVVCGDRRINVGFGHVANVTGHFRASGAARNEKANSSTAEANTH